MRIRASQSGESLSSIRCGFSEVVVSGRHNFHSKVPSSIIKDKCGGGCQCQCQCQLGSYGVIEKKERKESGNETWDGGKDEREDG